MNRITAVLGSILFFFVAPFVIAGVIPWWITNWQLSAPFLNSEGFRFAGLALAALGLLVLVDSFARFALQGLGTPAPIAPPTHLVVTGFYRHVRNPIYVAVVAAVLGQAVFFANEGLLVYAALLWVAFHVFVRLYEEPTLRDAFGSEYDTYCKHVPRWIPRVMPWHAEKN